MSVVVLYVLCLGWGVFCGAVVYEHLCVIPQWVQEPPASLTMWRGPHRLRAERFWMSIHPVLIVLLAAALWLHWGDAFSVPLPADTDVVEVRTMLSGQDEDVGVLLLELYVR